jgi:hypothetical protein
MIDNLDVLDKYPECKTEEVLKSVYSRVNIYMNNIQARDAYEENLPLVRPYIVEMMERLQPYTVKSTFSIPDLQRYHSFLSPFDTLGEGDVIEIPSKEFDNLKNEHIFFNNAIKSQQKDIAKLKKKNRKLKEKNKKLKEKNKKLQKKKNVKSYKKEYDSVINSTSWKLTKPLRAIKRIFK